MLILIIRGRGTSLVHLMGYCKIVAIRKYPMPKIVGDQMNKE